MPLHNIASVLVLLPVGPPRAGAEPKEPRQLGAAEGERRAGDAWGGGVVSFKALKDTGAWKGGKGVAESVSRFEGWGGREGGREPSVSPW